MTSCAHHRGKPGAWRARLCALASLTVVAAVGFPVAAVDGSASSEVAAALGLPSDRIRVLDERPLVFAFVEGEYRIFTIRNLATSELQDVTLDQATGERVDPDGLRARDRELAASEGKKLTPALRDLLVRHPELSALEVRATFDEPRSGAAGQGRARLESELARLGIEASPRATDDGLVLEVSLPARLVARLARIPSVRAIELVADPVILDH
jgi:hypothetical protein